MQSVMKDTPIATITAYSPDGEKISTTTFQNISVFEYSVGRNAYINLQHRSVDTDFFYDCISKWEAIDWFDLSITENLKTEEDEWIAKNFSLTLPVENCTIGHTATTDANQQPTQWFFRYYHD